MTSFRRLVVLFIVVGCTADTGPGDEALDRLRAVADRPTSVSRQADGRVRAVSTSVAVAGATAEERAGAFLQEFGEILGVDEPGDFTHRETREDGDGSGETVVYGGTQDGHPVFGSEVLVHVEDGSVRYAAAGVVADPRASLGEVTISEAEALAAIRAAIRAPTAAAFGEASVVAFNVGIFGDETTASDLAWMLQVRGPGSLVVRAFVHARRAEVLGIASLTHGAFDEEVHSFTHVAPELFDSSDWASLIPMAELQYTQSGAVAGVEGTSDARRVHGYDRTIYDYYMDVHGRDSLDGMGMKLMSFVDWNASEPNAFWDSTNSSMVYHPGVVTLDVAAHELTHGVVSYTADLVYLDQAGALNESMADTFAAFVDGNWTIGEFAAIGMLRDMRDPPVAGQPHHMDQFYSNRTDNSCVSTDDCGDYQLCVNSRCETSSDYTDYGGVHINSGIPNHVAFLAAVGGTHTHSGIRVQAIGASKLRHVVYRALSEHMHAGTTFTGYRAAARQAAIDIIESGEPIALTYEECGHILDAFAAVGIGAEDKDHDCFDDAEDNCPCVYNPEQDPAACEGMDASCTEPECAEDSECGGGQECSPAGICKSPYVSPGGCHDISDCPGSFCQANLECYVAPPPCSDHADCASCAADGCGWCDGMCTDASGVACADIGSVVTNSASCEAPMDACGSATECGSCTEQPGCGWCGGVCVSETAGCMTDFPTSLSECVECGGFGDCTSCAGNGYCSWCPGTGCVNDSLTDCPGEIPSPSMCPG